MADKRYFPVGFDCFAFVDDLNIKIETGEFTTGKSVASDWLKGLTDLELALLLKMLDKIRDDIQDLNEIGETVMLLVRLYFMETGHEKFTMTEEYLFESMSMFHMAACVEGMSRNGWVEYDPIGITHDGVQVRATESGKKMLKKIMNAVDPESEKENYSGLNAGLAKFFEENVEKWQ